MRVQRTVGAAASQGEEELRMKRILLMGVATLAMGAAPAVAGVGIEVVNDSSQVIEQVVGFHLDADGAVIDDVVGGIFEPLAPGSRITAELGGPCQMSSIWVRLANGQELTAKLDTCKDRTLVVSD